MTQPFSKLWARRHRDAYATAVIAVFFLLFFWPLLFGDKFFVTSDAFFYSYPLRTLAWNALQHGSLPLWTPLLMGGYPLLSMGQIALAYPLTWGYMFFPGYKAEVIYVLAPFLLAPVFMYAYAREIGRSRRASLLAGLSFTYGGMMAGMLSNSGYTTNSVMWLPLMLVGIERSRTRRFLPALLCTTGAYMLSVLNGHGQTFLFIGLIAGAYAVFLSLGLPATHVDQPRGWWGWDRLKPIALVLLAIGGAAGVSAFQIFETLRVTQLSIRHSLPYEVFIEGSFTLWTMLRSSLLPLHYDLEVTTYLSPLALCLAAVAVVFTIRNSERERRVFFWVCIGLIALVLMLGGNSPIYKFIYHIPIINRFRVPARHSFEWTFAVAVLAAYGWDMLVIQLKNKGSKTAAALNAHSTKLAFIGLSGAAMVAVVWWWAVYHSSAPMSYARTGYPVLRYSLWKILFVLVLFSSIWWSRSVVNERLRALLLTAAIVLACFPEPYMLISRWWFTAAKPASRFEVVSDSTRFLLENQPEQNRVYTRVNLFVEENRLAPSVDPLNLTALYGLRNVAGYEPLILERYSRALDNVGYDSMTTRPGLKSEQTIFDSRSHVLDLLNTRFVVTYSNPLYAEGSPTVERDGIKFSGTDDGVDLKPGTSASLTTHSLEGDTLALVTSLSNSAAEAQGAIIARLQIFTADGQKLEKELRAGVDTAEWAHERADVHAVIQHELAPVFNSTPDPANNFIAHNYWTKIKFDRQLRIERLEVSNVSSATTLTIWKGTLHDSARNHSLPLTNSLLGLVSDRWQSSKPDPATIEKEGIKLRADDQEAVELNPGEAAELNTPGEKGDTVVLVTSLAHAANESDGAKVARLRIITKDGSLVERDLRAGVDTAEWAHERPDVRSVVRHHLAPIFDSRQEGEANSFPAHRYWTRIRLTKQSGIISCEIVNTTQHSAMTIWKASILDSTAQTSTPISFSRSDRWRRAYENDNVIVLRNDRALPRAWLVAEAQALNSEEVFSRIRGSEDTRFDPKRTALVETADALPNLPGGPISPDATAIISSSAPNELVIETSADTRTMLVVSEIAYPGWNATVDGNVVPIYVTDYLLRGVALPAGSHRVEMSYRAPWAKAGAAISIVTLLLLVGAIAYVVFKRHPAPASAA